MILVTGGTGLVGSHLLMYLLQNNNAVRAIYRNKNNLDRVAKVFSYYTDDSQELFEKIQWFQADLNDIPALEEAFDNVEYVYHAAALISFDPNDYSQLKKTNALGTANIVNQCLTNKVKKLCYVSTIGAIGKSPKNMEATEENEWNGHDANVYALTKHRAEMEVWRGSQEGLPVVIINPGVIIGPGFWDSGSGKFFTTALKGYNFYPPGGTGFISVVDVVKMMIGLMHSKIENQRFVAVEENLTFHEILTKITKELNKEAPTIALKFWQLEIVRILDFMRNMLTGKKRFLTKNTIRSLMYQEIYNNRKIKNALDFKFNPLASTLEFCCQKFIEENQ